MITSIASCSQVFFYTRRSVQCIIGLAVKDHKLDDIVKIVKIDSTEKKVVVIYFYRFNDTESISIKK